MVFEAPSLHHLTKFAIAVEHGVLFKVTGGTTAFPMASLIGRIAVSIETVFFVHHCLPSEGLMEDAAVPIAPAMRQMVVTCNTRHTPLYCTSGRAYGHFC
jgi:hypothetical protein